MNRARPTTETILAVFAGAADSTMRELADKHDLTLEQVRHIARRSTYRRVTYELWRELSPAEREFYGKVRVGRPTKKRGKLTSDQAREIFAASTWSVSDLAHKYGVSEQTIVGIQTGRTWGWATEDLELSSPAISGRSNSAG